MTGSKNLGLGVHPAECTGAVALLHNAGALKGLAFDQGDQMKKITKAVLYIPDAVALADSVQQLMDLMGSTTGVIDGQQIRTEIMSHARLTSTSHSLTEFMLTSVADPSAYLDHIDHRMEQELAEGVLRELKIITTEEEGPK